MPITLDDSVGGAASNTFASLAYYKSYLETRLPAVTWLAEALAGTIDEKLKVDLIQAQRILSRSLDWTGSATDSVQVLPWPRKGMFNANGYAIAENVNPNELKDAQCELAIQVRNIDLLSDNQATVKGVKKVKAGSVEVEFQAKNKSNVELIDADLRLLDTSLDWTRIPTAVRLLLVDSWYNRETLIANELLFLSFG